MYVMYVMKAGPNGGYRLPAFGVWVPNPTAWRLLLQRLCPLPRAAGVPTLREPLDKDFVIELVGKVGETRPSSAAGGERGRKAGIRRSAPACGGGSPMGQWTTLSQGQGQEERAGAKGT